VLQAEFFFGVNAMPLDPDLMNFAMSRTKKGKCGKSALLYYNLQRGRFVKAIIPKDSNIKSCQLAVAATIRAAAPYQKLRRQYRDKLKSILSLSLIIDKADFRIKRLSKKSRCVVYQL
jgi:Mg-chelatase subunit ChlD